MSCEISMLRKLLTYSIQLLSLVLLFVTPRTAAHQAFLSITNSQNSLKMQETNLTLGCEAVKPSVQSLSHVRLFAAPWTTARQAFLSITNSRSLLKPMSIELVMPFNNLILCCPLLLLPSVFPSISIFSNESALLHRVPLIVCKVSSRRVWGSNYI